jgi:hypothetical protein
VIKKVSKSVRVLLCLFTLVTVFTNVSAREFFVAMNGVDTDSGTFLKPLKTIQKAASLLQAGDTCTVREGIYREWVKPVRSGTSETKRIVYRVYNNEKVFIRGSERITSWVKTDNIWKATIENSFFGNYNPYKLTLNGLYIETGKQNHRGEVYLKGIALFEKFSLNDVKNSANTWYVESPNQTQIAIYANFGTVDPNVELSEINVRECVFYPSIKGLQYITVDGFTIQHSADNWVGMKDEEKGLLGTYWGKCWIIQNCIVTDAKCVGINCGNDKVDLSDIQASFDMEAVGHHIVRNNLIKRCGENGIMGYKGWVASIFENNIIEDINYKKAYGGWETGGVKIHLALDIIFRNNIIRRVYAQDTQYDYVGIWFDYGSQGSRITGNVVYDIEGAPINLMLSHGPTLIDNNIFVGKQPAEHTSECQIFVHNLFANCSWTNRSFPYEIPPYFTPHTAIRKDIKKTETVTNHFYNNIFITKGSDLIAKPPEYKSNWNVFYDGAKKANGKDSSSIVSNFSSDLKITTFDSGVTVSFKTNTDPVNVKCPVINAAFIGKHPLSNQSIEDHDGNPITVNTDIMGKSRSSVNPSAGPLENPLSGLNEFTIIAGPKKRDIVNVMYDSNPKQNATNSNPKLTVFANKKTLIVTNNYSHDGVVTVFNSLGKTIFTKNVVCSGQNIAVSQNLLRGLYIAQVSYTNGIKEEYKVVVR